MKLDVVRVTRKDCAKALLLEYIVRQEQCNEALCKAFSLETAKQERTMRNRLLRESLLGLQPIDIEDHNPCTTSPLLVRWILFYSCACLRLPDVILYSLFTFVSSQY